MSIRILLVDDHAIVRAGLRRILESSPGFVVIGEASSGREALRLAGDLMPDVLLTDISMPGMNGVELVSRLIADNPNSCVLVLSMHSEDQFAVRVMKLGAKGYLNKANAPELLIEAVKKVAGGGRYISPAVADALANAVMPNRTALPHMALSNRELQILLLLVGGKQINEVADELSISPNTVSTHKSRLMEKLGVDNNAALVQYAVQHELVQ